MDPFIAVPPLQSRLPPPPLGGAAQWFLDTLTLQEAADLRALRPSGELGVKGWSSREPV